MQYLFKIIYKYEFNNLSLFIVYLRKTILSGDGHPVIYQYITIDYELKRFQRTFQKFAAFALRIECAPHEYQPVLQCLHLSTLCDRRKQANLTFLSKLINGEVDPPALLYKLNFRIPSFYSRYSFPFRIPFSRCNYLTNRHIVHMMKLANEDPLSLVPSIKLLSVRSLYLNICNFCYLCNFLLVIMYTIQCDWVRPVFNNK